MATEKARLRAHLSAARAELLWQLLDLDEHTLSARAVVDDWTAKDILAHIAAWDELFTERTELALAKREADIVPVDPDTHDTAMHAERKEWSFERSLQACLRARKAYLDCFARVPEEELDRPIPMPTSGMQSMRRWAEWRYQHDAEHAADLASWRQRLAVPRSPGPKSLLLATLRAARKELLTAQALLPAEERETHPICDHWTLKDVLEYLAHEERLCLDGLRRLPAGHAPREAVHRELEHYQQQLAGLQSAPSWEEVWTKLHVTRQALLRLLADFSQKQLESTYPSPLGTESTVYSVVRACVARDRRYAAELHTISRM